MSKNRELSGNSVGGGSEKAAEEGNRKAQAAPERKGGSGNVF